MTTTQQALAVNERDMDVPTMLAQIGHMNVLATSGGRIRRLIGPGANFGGGALQAVELPVSSGYSVRITLAASDTYTVQRVMRRGAKTWVKGTMTDVYAEDLGEVVYVAGCYKNRNFAQHDVGE